MPLRKGSRRRVPQGKESWVGGEELAVQEARSSAAARRWWKDLKGAMMEGFSPDSCLLSTPPLGSFLDSTQAGLAVGEGR
jgi:hypothetical protein